MERTPNKSPHRKLTLDKKILPPLLPGFEQATLRPRVRRSTSKLSWLPKLGLNHFSARLTCPGSNFFLLLGTKPHESVFTSGCVHRSPNKAPRCLPVRHILEDKVFTNETYRNRMCLPVRHKFEKMFTSETHVGGKCIYQ